MKKKAKKKRAAAQEGPRLRSAAEKTADESARGAFEQGEFLTVSEADRAAGLACLKERRAAREESRRDSKAPRDQRKLRG